MSFLRRPLGEPAPNSTYARARKRLSTLTDEGLLNWADQAGSGVARALNDYRRDRAVEGLQEAKLGLDSLQALVDLLIERQGPS